MRSSACGTTASRSPTCWCTWSGRSRGPFSRVCGPADPTFFLMGGGPLPHRRDLGAVRAFQHDLVAASGFFQVDVGEYFLSSYGELIFGCQYLALLIPDLDQPPQV